MRVEHLRPLEAGETAGRAGCCRALSARHRGQGGGKVLGDLAAPGDAPPQRPAHREVPQAALCIAKKHLRQSSG